MSYAIIRNVKCSKSNLKGMYRHNERKNSSYSNKDIDFSKTSYNYSLKSTKNTYYKEFELLKEKFNIEGWIKKNSKVVCEIIVTSDNEFFNSIGPDETKRYFQTAYNFIKSYKNLGEDFIISAQVHMDEKTPHMHVIYIPVIHKKDPVSGEIKHKVCCSEFWKGQKSYSQFQDSFFKYISKAHFDLERGKNESNEHLDPEEYKRIINYESQKFELEALNKEFYTDTNNINELKTINKRVIKKFNTLANQYTKIKQVIDDTSMRIEQTNLENEQLIYDNENLKKENHYLKTYIEKAILCTSILINWPLDRVKRFWDNFYKNR